MSMELGQFWSAWSLATYTDVNGALVARHVPRVLWIHVLLCVLYIILYIWGELMISLDKLWKFWYAVVVWSLVGFAICGANCNSTKSC